MSEGPSTSKEPGKATGSGQKSKDLSVSLASVQEDDNVAHETLTREASAVTEPSNEHINTPPREEPKHDGFLQRVKGWSPVLVLENSGSVGASYGTLMDSIITNEFITQLETI